jgi:hypothetical protein
MEVMSMQLEQLPYTEEQIKQAIEEAWQELLQEADAEDYSLEEYLEHYRKYWNDPDFPNDIPEIIIRAVEKLIGKSLAWYCELVRDPSGFTGEYSFIAVDPQTRKCLTYRQFTFDGVNVHYFLSVAGTVIYYEDIIRLVVKLLNKIQPELVTE